jgi:dolichyl-diphosphooligosaccharide--protein glycosyltransferase
MTDVRAAIEAFLEERPECEEHLETLVAVDESEDAWTFDDVALESGTFGELVSRGIVEKEDGAYELADRAAVRRALDSETAVEPTDTQETSSDLLSLSDVEIDRRSAIGLTSALALVVLFRVLPLQSVFRGSDVVLSGNDPYAYRYLVHQLLAQSSNPLDLAVLSELPSRISHGEPLLVSVLWWVSAVFGGSSTADYVLAWYPVVSAVLAAILVYVLAVRVTADKRVGLGAVALLAITPAHAFRTGLGFADHHAFDYPWLALTALAVVMVVDADLRKRRTWLWSLALGVGVGGQTLAWDAGPLLLVPIALFAVAVVPSWLRADRSPVREGSPLIAGLAVGALVALGGHVGFGWHSLAVVMTPALLLAGVIGVIALGEAANRFDISVRTVVATEVTGAIAGIVILRSIFPSFTGQLDRGLQFLVSTKGIAETMSLVSGDLGNIVGPIFVFGFALFLAFPYLGWATWWSYRTHSPGWLALSLYAWYFLSLAVVQLRFAGELALFVAVFGGLGFVHVAAWVDMTSDPKSFQSDSTAASPRVEGEQPRGDEPLEWPERRRALSLAGLGIGVGSLGMLNTSIKHSQVSIEDSIYDAAQFMRAYSTERGWEYPENYVFSQWGRNRVYNWFVNGESQSYGYAQANYADFVTSTDSEAWYERLRDRAGFVVVGDQASIGGGGQTIHERLWADDFGLGTDHYRVVWAATDDSRRVYTLVAGARMTGPTAESGTISIKGECELAGQSKQLTMEHSVGESGVYDITVPLPGTYAIGDDEIELSETDVRDGTLYSLFDGESDAHWSFDEGDGDVAYDRAGGRHAEITGGTWIEGVDGTALSFDGDGHAQAAPVDGTTEAFTVSAWIKPAAESSGAILSTGKDGWSGRRTGFLFDHGLSGWNDDRLGLYLGNGDSSRSLTSRKLGIEYPASEFRHVAVVFDRGDIRWYLDGERFSSGSADMQQVVHSGDKATYDGREFSGQGGLNKFTGAIDELRYYESALTDADIADLASIQ